MIYLRRLFRKADKLLAEDSQQPTLTRKAVNYRRQVIKEALDNLSSKMQSLYEQRGSYYRKAKNLYLYLTQTHHKGRYNAKLVAYSMIKHKILHGKISKRLKYLDIHQCELNEALVNIDFVMATQGYWDNIKEIGEKLEESLTQCNRKVQNIYLWDNRPEETVVAEAESLVNELYREKSRQSEKYCSEPNIRKKCKGSIPVIPYY